MIACMMRKLKCMESYPHKLCVVAGIMTGFSCCFWKCERDSGHKKQNCLLVFYNLLIYNHHSKLMNSELTNGN
jgi:hypothetical protein